MLGGEQQIFRIGQRLGERGVEHRARTGGDRPAGGVPLTGEREAEAQLTTGDRADELRRADELLRGRRRDGERVGEAADERGPAGRPRSAIGTQQRRRAR